MRGAFAPFLISLTAEKNGTAKSDAAAGAIRGILSLAGGIGAAVFSLLAMFAPKIEGLLDIIILAVFSGWLILSGVNSVFSSIRIKKMRRRELDFHPYFGYCSGTVGYIRDFSPDFPRRKHRRYYRYSPDDIRRKTDCFGL